MAKYIQLPTPVVYDPKKLGQKDSDHSIPVVLSSDYTLPVTTSCLPGESIFGTASSVANGSLTLVLTYTVPSLKIFQASQVQLEGDNVAKWTIEVNGTEIARSRFSYTSFETVVNLYALPSGCLELESGDTIVCKVLQESRANPGNYSARLTGVLKNE
jgi:hypothetical protein